ncbi:Ionotropic glutamate receptor [Dillenia turbinata]|uniref:Ionotropic glutamate receptor n=1 Tax=Dillenia turbinata TaxID=194707 RepID=A0AAN8VHF1_9MAGN
MMKMSQTKIVLSLLVFCFSLGILFTIDIGVVAQNTTKIPVNVGVVLDLETSVGRIGLSCINMSLTDFYTSHRHYNTRLNLNVRNSKGNVVSAASSALDLIKNVEVKAIIGPEDSMETDFVIDLGDKAQVPIVSFSATSPLLSSIQAPYFVRAAQNDSAQVKAISAIVQAYEWREAVPIYADNEYGNGVIPFLTDALQEIDTRVPYRSIISPSATDDQIAEELYKLMTMQTRVFIVHMLPSLGFRLFLKAKEIGMMTQDYAWIMTDGITALLNFVESSAFDSMQGVLGVRPYVPITQELQNFTKRWQATFHPKDPNIINLQMNIFGLWAYDTASALAIAVEKVGFENSSFLKASSSQYASTDLESLGVSQIGPMLRQALLESNFTGLSGEFQLIDGQLQSSKFEIINIVSNGVKRVGFWTPGNGIVRDLNLVNSSTSSMTYSVSKGNLGTIIWPGDSTSPPKGWVIPTSGKKLRVGVPVKEASSKFVNVTRDPSTNTTIVTGYCIDVFDAVVASLSYAVPYEFVPFAKPDGSSAGSYDDLIYQVYLQKFDAVAGDVTIIANRSLYVDFTLPYTVSGVTMIVPIRDQRSKNAWVFLKPLTRDLWITTGCFFIFIGFVIWLLEHRVNDDFRGPPSHQIGMVFWFAFSTMVFAHKEKVVNNLARFVLILWIFVVLILTSSYTASLTSLLTVQQLQPTVADVSVLLKKGEYVGYASGSFVYGMLIKMGFDPSKLRVYNSLDELDAKLAEGSASGGVAAAFDEIPYMKLFLATYCSKYTMVQPTYQTGGFGFVFPRGSPLGSDVSRAVLNVTEGDKMEQIEKAWLGDPSSCSYSTTISSNSLAVHSFWGLFLIAGLASILALITFVLFFLYEHRKELMKPNPNVSFWRRLIKVMRRYDDKDFSCKTFRRSGFNNKEDNVDAMDGRLVAASQNNNLAQSQSSSSQHTDSIICYGDEGTPVADNGSPLNQNELAHEAIVSLVELVLPHDQHEDEHLVSITKFRSPNSLETLGLSEL